MKKYLVVGAAILAVGVVGIAQAAGTSGGAVNITFQRLSPTTYVTPNTHCGGGEGGSHCGYITTAVAYCPAGTVVLGGGYISSIAPLISDAVQTSQGHGWQVDVPVSYGGAFRATVMCGKHVTAAAADTATG
jgi:hypothetical protein